MKRAISLSAGLFGAILFLPLTPATAQAAPSASTPGACAVGQRLGTPPSNVTPICGLYAPEDLVVMPDKRHIVASSYDHHEPKKTVADLMIIDTANDKLSVLPRRYDNGENWGDPDCKPVPGFSSHGIDLTRRTDGKMQLLVVNHAGREAIDFFELAQDKSGPVALWRGCVAGTGGEQFNDVSATADGGFVASVMYQIDKQGKSTIGEDLTADTGYLAVWEPGGNLERLPGSEASFNNGVQVSPDGRSVYFSAYMNGQVRVYDLDRKATTARIDIGFYPDNLTVGDDGDLIVAGNTDVQVINRCFEERTKPCPVGGAVARWNPATSTVERLFTFPAGIIPGTSVALRHDGRLYIGAFSGDRVLKVENSPSKK